MPSRSVLLWTASLGVLAIVGLGRASLTSEPAQLTLDLATLHAAALTKARDKADSSDAPYLLVSVVGSAGRKETLQLPGSGHFALALDGAVGNMNISTLSVQPGDSVRVLLTVLEGREASAQERQVAAAVTTMMADRRSLYSAPSATNVTPTLAPLTTAGAHWLGTASLLLTNEGGKTYWTALDCVAMCTVSRSPAAAGPAAVVQQTPPQLTTGVVELSGASAIYHL